MLQSAKQKVRVDFSDFWHANTAAAKLLNPIYRLLTKRFDVELCEHPDFLIYSCFGLRYIRHRGVRIFYTGENRRPNYSLCDWAFGFDFSDDPRYFRWPYYALFDRPSLLSPRDANLLFPAKTHFCSFIYSNAHAKVRLKFLDKLSRYKPVDCGGKVRNNMGYLVADKVAFMQRYKFNIAFENDSSPGYTSEKLAEALQAQTVPIYWGNPLAGRDFNAAAFVNCHDFRDLDEAVDFVVELDKNDELYRRYLGAPSFVDNRPGEFMGEARVLDRFEEIFSSPVRRPVARSLKGRIASLAREPKRILRQHRMER